jgi:hypothetical protein
LPEQEEIVDNHIEERLNDLMEETRRKLYKYEQCDDSPVDNENEMGFV